MDGNELNLVIRTDKGGPLRARVTLRYHTVTGITDESESDTDFDGLVCLPMPALARAEFVVVSPKEPGYWNMYAEGDSLDDFAELCAIPLDDIVGAAWWLQCLGIDPQSSNRGADIKIGVVDADFRDHADLSHVIKSESGFVALGATGRNGWGHAEVVCRIISDRHPLAASSLSVAPMAQLIFADASSRSGEINPAKAVKAVNDLATIHEVDLINLSWGRSRFDPALHDAIEAAEEKGVTIIAAAGNDPLEAVLDFPARTKKCIAVAALGWAKWGPPGTAACHFSRVGASLDRTGKAPTIGPIYAWSEGTYGKELDAIVPGVGIFVQRSGELSYEISGSSFATAMVSGLLAVVLAADSRYKSLPKSVDRAKYGRQTFKNLCRSVGLKNFEGRGLPGLS